MSYQKQWVERDDHVQGYLYLMKAEGFHGLFPGCILSRVKIGLSRNPQKRLDEFHSNQPPCNIKILRTIYVQDMKSGEDWLHHRFKQSNVKLVKSREWHDFNPLQLFMVQRAFDRLETQNNFRPRVIAKRSLVAGLLIAAGTGALLLHQPEPKTHVAPTVTSQPHPHQTKRLARHHS